MTLKRVALSAGGPERVCAVTAASGAVAMVLTARPQYHRASILGSSDPKPDEATMIRTTWTGLLTVTGLAIGLGLAGTGCGGGGTGGAGGGASTPEAACEDYGTVVCSKLDTCAPFLIALGYGDAATCADRAGLSCASVLKLPAITATADDYSACASAYGQLSCDDLFGGSAPAACQSTHGNVADGVACATDAECKSGQCGSMTASGCGVCAHEGALGDSCDPAIGNCGSGTFCSSTTSTCEASNVAKGGMCGASAQCKSTLECINGVCAAPLAEGAPCDPMNAHCDFLQGLECSSASNVCTKVKLAGPGETCGFDSMSSTLIFCKKGGNCVTDGNATGICATPIADGAACTVDPMKGDPCLAPARCRNSVCALDLPTCK